MTTILLPGTIIALALATLMALAAGAASRAIGRLSDRWESWAHERSPIDFEPGSREWLEFERAYRSYADRASGSATACVQCRCSQA